MTTSGKTNVFGPFSSYAYRKFHTYFDPKDKEQGLFAKVLELIVVKPCVLIR